MFSIPGAKKQAEDKKKELTCPEGKVRSKDTCAACNQKTWCPAIMPSLEYVSVPDDLKKWINF